MIASRVVDSPHWAQSRLQQRPTGICGLDFGAYVQGGGGQI